MNSPHSFLSQHRHHRVDAPPGNVLNDLSADTPLYIHARNWMAEMASITYLTECVMDDESQIACYPEQGLYLSLDHIEYLHTVAIEHRSRASLALEIATDGEPRAISISAIPLLSDLPAFTACLAEQPFHPLSAENYEKWRASHLTRPSICSCCADAAEERRKKPEIHPLTKIFHHAIEQQMTLHCCLASPAFRFFRSILPGALLFQGGRITLTSQDGNSMLEIDPGYCHSLTLHRTSIDAEPMTRLRIYNSLGTPELTIETPDWDACDQWLSLCRQC